MAPSHHYWGVLVVAAVAPCWSAAQDILGSCMCDLTSVVCDPNCRCDPDCTKDEVDAAFTSCRREQHASKRIVLCREVPDLLEPRCVNPVFGSGLEEYYTKYSSSYSRDAEEKLVCVRHDNLGLEERTYARLAEPLSAVEMAGIEENADNSRVWRWEHTTPYGSGSTYKVGDRVAAALINPLSTDQRQLVERSLPWLTTPRNVYGKCRRRVYAKFMDTGLIGGAPCTLHEPLAHLCKFTANLSSWAYLAIGPALTRARVVFVDHDTKATLATYNSNGNERTLSPLGTELQGNRCVNAVASVAMQVVYSMEGEEPTYSTREFHVTVGLSTIEGSTPEAKLTWQQTHSLVWSNKVLNGATPVERSGNPGYLQGKSIAFGVRSDDGTVERSQYPFHVPFGTHCTKGGRLPLRFQHNVLQAGCYLELTLREMEATCITTDTAQKALETVRQAMVPTGAAVASFGNSDPAVGDDWVDMQDLSPRPPEFGFYSGVTRTCRNLHIGYEYTFVVRRAGVVYNPQDKIVGVLRKNIISNWTFTLPDADAVQRFHLNFRVSFVRQPDASTISDEVKDPPWLPVVSSDVFYPFRIHDRGAPGDDEL